MSTLREEGEHLLVGLVAHRAQQLGRLELALAVDLDVQLVPGRGLELQPGAAVGDDLGAVQRAAGGGVLGGGVVDARGAHQLADHDALGAVDDERALVGHGREVAHVDPLLLDLAGLLDAQLDLDVERLGEGQVAGAALELGVLGLAELVVLEVELHHLAGEVLDGADLVEQLPQPVLDEPAERIPLELDQVRDGQDLGDPAVTLPLRSDEALRRAASVRDRQHEAAPGGEDEDRGTRGRLNAAQGHTADRSEKGGHAHRTGIVLPAAYTVNGASSRPNAAGYRTSRPMTSPLSSGRGRRRYAPIPACAEARPSAGGCATSHPRPAPSPERASVRGREDVPRAGAT